MTNKVKQKPHLRTASELHSALKVGDLNQKMGSRFVFPDYG
jgi:hypothetical protein